MQFIKDGPDIPEHLLQAHEDGRVVFFCGAGISAPASLPGFSGLVKQLFGALSETPNAVQQAAIKAGQFDTAIGLLEAGITGGRSVVRPELADILTVDPTKLSAPNTTATHQALLTLAKNRDGKTRLITTNFDRLFEAVIDRQGLAVQRFQAPFLPVPKNNWDGLVYLHGLLSTAPTEGELNRLVVSSGDFGLAYLTERWAARFVSELLRKYTVCFIGYSINDPVLRYMMDALAADQLLGESPPEMFAFGSYAKGKEKDRADEWRAKQVTPILYREHNRHSYLHKTLRAWADTYRDGVRGKERIVTESAMARPSASTREDDFVGRMLWALSDPTGLPARRFAEHDPAPSLDWLEPLSKPRYGHGDLAHFGVPPHAAKDDALSFSVIHRPSPYPRAPKMALVDAGATGSDWDDVMPYLARWLTRHLDDPALVLWLAQRGGQLHHRLGRLIKHQLDEFAPLEREGKTDELERIRANAPNAIPRPLMRTLWRLLLTGRVKSGVHDLALYSWEKHFERDGLTPSLRMQLRELLTPRVVLSPPLRLPARHDAQEDAEQIENLVSWDIALTAGDGFHAIRREPKRERWTGALPALLTDFSALLRDTLDLMQELDPTNKGLRTFFLANQRPILEGDHNGNREGWTVLIDLTREAWLASAAHSPEQARRAAEAWWQAPYPLFKRLAFFAAAHDGIVPNRVALDWMLSDVWRKDTANESIRLLTALAPRLDKTEVAELEQAILAGPPPAMPKKDGTPENRANAYQEHQVWRRLATMASTGTVLGTAAAARLKELSAGYPKWQLDAEIPDGIDFSVVLRGEIPIALFTPLRYPELVDWLKAHPKRDRRNPDDWVQRCRNDFPKTASALCALARDGVWPTERWQEALEVWRDGQLARQSWRYLGPILQCMPEDALPAIAHSATRWLEAVSEVIGRHEGIFLDLCRRFLDLAYEPDPDTDDPLTRAINHPVGQVTEALLIGWSRQPLEDGQGLPEALQPIFTQLCDPSIEKFRHGRVILAEQAILLFRVDPDWTKQRLLPLFDWQGDETEARAAWAGFLWAARFSPPVLAAMKTPFLQTAQHYDLLDQYGEPYTALLALAALEARDRFTIAELGKATGRLPPEGLRETARALVQILESAAEQRTDYWTNRMAPYWQSIWPKSKDRLTPEISASLANLCIAADDAFPAALAKLQYWLKPLAHPDYPVNKLYEADLCRRFPEAALDFLHRVIADNPPWLPQDLEKCLETVREKAPQLAKDGRFNRLETMLHHHGAS